MKTQAESLNEDLRFALLAMERHAVSQEQVVSVLGDWIADRSQTIRHLLESRKLLDAEQCHSLSEIARQMSPPLSTRATDDYATIQKTDPLHHSDSRDPSGLVATLVHSGSSLDGDSIVTDDDQTLASNPMYPRGIPQHHEHQGNCRYEILQEHAKGGLGEVFLARDVELQREVALKEIQEQHADDPNCRTRFLLEAQITGGLEHPGIVPVYGMGQYSDGRPYYAMRFIRGESFKEAVDRFYKMQAKDTPSDQKETDDSISFRKLLGRFIHVCNAIEYAHSRGVLHRDLKPNNIMLGRYDETLVVDWGLAKVHGRNDPTPAAETTLRPNSSSIAATQMGSAVGTPAFMSPEQAAGDLEQLGPHSDIYSLGATLYYLLTGQAPFGRDDIRSTLSKVREGKFDPPRLIRSEVPRGLESICLKAMSRLPADRYARAAELAEDIERWLADEPVKAHQETAVEKGGRWIRRNRSTALYGILGLALMTMLSLVSVLVINNARHEAQVKGEDASRERLKQEKLAKEAVEQRLVADNLRKEAETQKRIAFDESERAKEEEANAIAARKEAEKASEASKLLAVQKSLEAEKSKRLADFMIGIFQSSDPVSQGAAMFVGKVGSKQPTARDILDQGAKKIGSDKELQAIPLAKAAMMDTIGDVYRQLGLFEDAAPLLREAMEIRKSELPPDDPELAMSYHNLGWLHHEIGDYEIAKELYNQSLAIRRKIEGDEGKRLVANSLHNLAWLVANEGESEEGEKLFQQAADIRKETLGPENRDYLFSRMGVAFCLVEQERFLEALPIVLSSQQAMAKVLDNHNLTSAVTQFCLGLIFRETRGLEASRDQLQKALELTIIEFGEENIYSGLIKYELAITLERMGKKEEAMKLMEDCIGLAHSVVQMKHPRMRVLVQSYTNMLVKRGRAEEGIQAWEDLVVGQQTRFGEKHSYTLEAKIKQAQYLEEIGKMDRAKEIHMDIDRICGGMKDEECTIQRIVNAQLLSSLLLKEASPPEAENQAKNALQLFDRQPKWKKKNQIDYQINMVYLATSLVRQDKMEEARPWIENAIAEAKKIFGEDGRRAMDQSLAIQTEYFQRLGDHALMVKACMERQKLWPKSGSTLTRIASNLAQALPLAEKDPKLSEDEKSLLKQQYAAATIDILKQAVQVGFKKGELLESNPNFAPLRDLPEFKQLIEAVKSKE